MLKGVLIDWGGVLTVGLSEAVAEWIALNVPEGEAASLLG